MKHLQPFWELLSQFSLEPLDNFSRKLFLLMMPAVLVFFPSKDYLWCKYMYLLTCVHSVFNSALIYVFFTTEEKNPYSLYLFLTYLTFILFQHWLCKMSDNLQTPLDDQLASFSRSTNVSIRVFRLRSREGLVRARLVGSEASTGNVLVFLDAHCEVTEGWLPPLLDEIRKNRYFRFL